MAHVGYSGWLTTLAGNFTSKTDQWVNAVYPLVEGSLFHLDVFVGKLEIGCQCQGRFPNGITLLKVQSLLLYGDGKFVL